MPRFLYINIYSILIACAGIAVLVMPFYFITKWTLVIQGLIAIKLFMISGRLFSTWDAKKREIDILVNRNKNNFRPDTFDIFMQAPCGRLVVKEALQELNMQNEYKKLKKLKKPFIQNCRENCTPAKTIVYINEESK